MSPTQFFTPYFSNKKAVRHQPQPCGGAIWLPGSRAFWQHRLPSPPAASAQSSMGGGAGWGLAEPGMGRPRGEACSSRRGSDREVFLAGRLCPSLQGCCRVDRGLLVSVRLCLGRGSSPVCLRPEPGAEPEASG